MTQWYVPGSLEHLAAPQGVSTGFRFVFRSSGILFYVAHRIWLTVNGEEVPGEDITIVRQGTPVSATELVKTDWVCHRGELIEVMVDRPGGLTAGRHQVKLEAVFGGSYGGPPSRQPVTLCEFWTDLS